MIRKTSGFTALEMATTLAIVAILATFLLPPYLHWLRSYRLSGAVNNLICDVEMAKIRAIRENDFVAIQFQPTSYTMFLDNGEGGGTAGDWLQNGSEELVRYREMPAGVSIDTSAMTLANNRVRFNGRGLPPEVITNEDISIMNLHGIKTVTLNRLGLLELD
jgi:prepilin-type N-terminal cleavage/methylation domain-containing protein